MANLALMPIRNGARYYDTPPHQDPSALATIKVDGTPPKSRVRSPAQAQTIVDYLIEANRDRARKDAMIKGMFDGNAPYNAWKLRSRGEAWRANFNTLEAKGRKAAAKVPYYDLFAGAPTYIMVETNLGENESQRLKWSRQITENLDTLVLKQYPPFDFAISTMIDDYIAFGRGFLMHSDPDLWPFRRMDQSRVLVQDGESTDVDDELELICLRQKFKAPQLYKRIRNGSNSGWNTEAVMEAIYNATPDEEDDPWRDPMTMQQRLKDSDLYVTARSSTINTARLYVREFSGKITELIILEYGYSGRSGVKPDKFLFKREDRYKNFREVISPFFFDMEDGSWHGTSGYGKDLFAACQTKDRYWMSIIDSGFMRSCLLMQAKTPSAMQKAALQMIGNAIIIPPDVALQSSQMLGDITTGLEVNAAIENMLDSNTGIYRPRMEKPEGNPEPATVTQLRFAQNNMLNSTQVNRFLKQLDPCYAEMYRRIVAPQHGSSKAEELARVFQEACEKDGIPKEALKDVRFVRASRTLGNGSIAMRQQSIQTVAPMVPMLPEEGRSNWLDDLIAASADQSKVDRWNPKPEQAEMPSDQMDLAMLENAAMRTGAPVMWSPTQNNIIHAQTHLQAGAQAAHTLQQGANPEEVYSFLEAVGPHIAKHLQELGKDPTRKGAVKALTKQLHDLGAITDKLADRLKQQHASQQKARAVSSGMDPDTQLKAAETQAKMRNADMKTKHQMVLRQQQSDQKLAIGARTAEQKMAINDATAAADMRRKRFSAFDPGQP